VALAEGRLIDTFSFRRGDRMVKRERDRHGRAPQASPGSPASARAKTERRIFLPAVVLVALALAGTVDEQTIGSVPDEQQMAYTAVALAELGEIGIGRGQVFTVPRAGGDAVSPYGMGLSLVEVPVALAAQAWERSFGPRSSQTLYAALQILLVLLASAAAGQLAGILGASRRGEVLAMAGSALASPLWAYTGTGFSEPLQAACLAGALLFAARAVRSTAGKDLGLAAASGFLAGWALLTKSTNIVLVPLVLLPLLLDEVSGRTSEGKRKLGAAASAGLLLPSVLWLVFEVVRFGRPFSSYGEQGFSHPPLDGAWRLLVGANEGLFLYFPLSLLGLALIPALARKPETRGTAWGIGATFLCLLGLHAAWWAWDGTTDGPRFLVPAVPLLAAAACTAAASRPAKARSFLLAAGVLVNLLGILQPEATASWYVASIGKAPIPEGEAKRFPRPYVTRGADGGSHTASLFLAASDHSFSPFRTHLFLLRLRLANLAPEERLRLLQSPPWRDSHPRLLPRLEYPVYTSFGVVTRNLTEPFSWPWLGRATLSDAGERPLTFLGLRGTGLADQVGRKLDTGKTETAISLSRRLHEVDPSHLSAALLSESLRLSGRGDEARTVLRELAPDHAGSPFVLTEAALLARDSGDEPGARAILSAAQAQVGRPILGRALASPLSGWPLTLREMTGEARSDQPPGSPR
jgi:hypothetical protein